MICDPTYKEHSHHSHLLTTSMKPDSAIEFMTFRSQASASHLPVSWKSSAGRRIKKKSKHLNKCDIPCVGHKWSMCGFPFASHLPCHQGSQGTEQLWITEGHCHSWVPVFDGRALCTQSSRSSAMYGKLHKLPWKAPKMIQPNQTEPNNT